MKLLIADDERDIADAIGYILEYSGFECDVVYDGAAAREQASREIYDGMVLDIMMPKMSGVDVVKHLRAAGDETPVLLLTAKAETEDKISGLNAGADDYLTKPFDKGELLARINALLRRKKVYGGESITFGNTCLNRIKLEISNQENSLRLAGKEVELLDFLMENRMKWIGEDTLLHKIWPDGCAKGMMTLYMGYLRNKLNSIGSDLEIVMETGNRKDYQLRRKG
ncbi:MAG: response regulator transcription factor [Lachnospiraceae bacterium]|nr:response regulator transcription factor [Lachnospiraceae bacterium]MDD3796245.1 response regulator transcription factor [Lachnospiraceae bacterium]